MLPVRRATTLEVLAAVALGASGCSLMFVTPVRHEGSQTISGECTRVAFAPAVDTALAAAGMTATFEVASAHLIGEPDRYKGVAASAGVLILAGASAIYGFNKTAECRRADAGSEESDRPRDSRRTFWRYEKGKGWIAVTPEPPPVAPAPVVASSARPPVAPGEGGAAGAQGAGEAGVMAPSGLPAPPAKQATDNE
jgi:hypothetical protein